MGEDAALQLMCVPLIARQANPSRDCPLTVELSTRTTAVSLPNDLPGCTTKSERHDLS